MLGKKSTIGIFDCLEGQFRMLEKFPFIVGCMGNADWQVPGGEDWEGACMIKKSGNAFRIVPNKKGDERLLVNGGPFSEPFNVEDDEVCTLQFLGYPLIVFAGKDPKAWADQIQKGQWILANGRTATDYAQCRYEVWTKSGKSAPTWPMRHQAGWFGRPLLGHASRRLSPATRS